MEQRQEAPLQLVRADRVVQRHSRQSAATARSPTKTGTATMLSSVGDRGPDPGAIAAPADLGDLALDRGAVQGERRLRLAGPGDAREQLGALGLRHPGEQHHARGRAQDREARGIEAADGERRHLARADLDQHRFALGDQKLQRPERALDQLVKHRPRRVEQLVLPMERARQAAHIGRQAIALAGELAHDITFGAQRLEEADDGRLGQARGLGQLGHGRGIALVERGQQIEPAHQAAHAAFGLVAAPAALGPAAPSAQVQHVDHRSA